MNFLEKHKKNGLLEESFLSSWTDTIFKMGSVLYTNCCYYQSLKDFAFLCEQSGQKKSMERYLKKAQYTKEQINKTFWNGNFYSDWADLWAHNYFSSDGNVLAIVWGIADFEKAQRIENTIRQHRLNKNPLRNVYPPYPFWRVLWFLLPFHTYHYHNGASWPWLGALNVLALYAMRWKQEALSERKILAQHIVDQGTVMEVYWKQKPFSSLFLKSELHHSWTAGLLVSAFSPKMP